MSAFARTSQTTRRVLSLSALAVTGLCSTPALARGQVGDQAPWFQLERLSGGSVSSTSLRGKPVVLVVGRTQRAAPPCKTWALTLIERYGARVPVYQVIVVDKAWYIPRSAVLSRVRDFVPAPLYSQVLLEWYTVFADAYGIAEHHQPVVLVLDRSSVIRWRYQGVMSQSALERLGRAIGSVTLASRSTASTR